MSWYQIVRANANAADVEITGPIAEGDGDRFLRALPRADLIRLKITSPGGSAADGLTIARGLRARRGRVEAEVRGLVASAATLPLCAAHHARVAADACLMIHRPHIEVTKDSELSSPVLRDAAAALDTITDEMLTVYAWRIHRPRGEVSAMLNATTWLDADAAVRLGLADVVIAADLPVAARFERAQLAPLGTIPPRFARRIAAMTTAPAGPWSHAVNVVNQNLRGAR